MSVHTTTVVATATTKKQVRKIENTDDEMEVTRRKLGTVTPSNIVAVAPIEYNPDTGALSVDDATPGSKGVLALAGDLAGTAAAPTVPALATKADQADLDAESAARTAAVTALTNNLVDETTARQSTDTLEAATRSAADSQLSDLIAAETAARQTAVTNEHDARLAGDQQLANQISDVDDAIATETADRESAITAEANTRSTADATNAAAITAEAQTRANAVTAEANARTIADTNESNARIAADNLKANIASPDFTGTPTVNGEPILAGARGVDGGDANG